MKLLFIFKDKCKLINLIILRIIISDNSIRGNTWSCVNGKDNIIKPASPEI